MIKILARITCKHEITKVIPIPISDGYGNSVIVTHICEVCGKKLHNKYKNYKPIR